MTLAVIASIAITGCTSGLTGSVVSATTGDPIVGARVTIGNQTIQTDANGEFAFEQLSRAEFTGSVAVTGFPVTEFTCDVSNGSDSVAVKIEDAVVLINTTEAAVEPAAVVVTAATLDGVEATGCPLAFPPVPPGEHHLVISAENHETYDATLTVEAGEASVDVTLSLTPLATYERFLEASKYGRVDVEYQYIHPDERALLSLEKWTAMGQGLEMTSMTLGNVRMLATWDSLRTGKTYEDVAEIDRSVEYQVTDPQYSDFGMRFTDNRNQHWVKVDGIWYMVHLESLE